MNVRIIFFLLFTTFCQQAAAQVVSNVRFEQRGTNVHIYYDLGGTPEALYNVSLSATDQSGSLTEKTASLSGNIGANQTSGTGKTIVWNALQDIGRFNYSQVKFTITATLGYKNMVFVKGGSFERGSNEGESNEKPVRTISVSDFYISKYEVTNAEFCEFLNAKNNQTEGGVTWLEIESSYCKIVLQNGTYVPKNGYERHPVLEVSWYAAKAYAEWRGGRLPSEAEWEYAAGGGASTSSATGRTKWAGTNNESELKQYAWYYENSQKMGSNHANYGEQEVGTLKPNALGIYDTSGNVWEWCLDDYKSDYYVSCPEINPINITNEIVKSIRGGAWGNYAGDCRVSYRSGDVADLRIGSVGFRFVLSVM